jgi:phosphatidate cytidylyltransferase
MAALWHKHPLLGQYLPIIFTFITIAGLIIEIGKPTLHPIPNLGSMVLGAVYVGWLFSFIIRLRSIESVDLPINHPGSWLLFYTCGITWISDTGGLIAGNLMGRIKLAPSISPAKTWEGVFGGALAGTTLGIVIGHYLHFAPLLSVSLSLLISLCAPIGDLCESALKRNLGLKDFGTFFANHGGVLDRIDSLLFTAPVAYYFILVYLSPK